MKITEQEIKEINTHGFKTILDDYGVLMVETPTVNIMINKRPVYCNRGRYGFSAEVKPEFRYKMNIDSSDAFPRYFFSLQRGFDEVKDWEDFRNEMYPIK